MPMPEVRIELFRGGSCRHLHGMVVRRSSWSAKTFPSTFAVIFHLSQGITLFDTGYSERFLEQMRAFSRRRTSMSRISEKSNPRMTLQEMVRCCWCLSLDTPLARWGCSFASSGVGAAFSWPMQRGRAPHFESTGAPTHSLTSSSMTQRRHHEPWEAFRTCGKTSQRWNSFPVTVTNRASGMPAPRSLPVPCPHPGSRALGVPKR